jgi:hypothetical protein
MTAPPELRVTWCQSTHPATDRRCARLAHSHIEGSIHRADRDNGWTDTPNREEAKR